MTGWMFVAQGLALLVAILAVYVSLRWRRHKFEAEEKLALTNRILAERYAALLRRSSSGNPTDSTLPPGSRVVVVERADGP